MVLLHALVVVTVRGVEGKLAFFRVINSLSLIAGIRLVTIFCVQTPVSIREDEPARYCVLISEMSFVEVMPRVIMISELASLAKIDCS